MRSCYQLPWELGTFFCFLACRQAVVEIGLSSAQLTRDPAADLPCMQRRSFNILSWTKLKSQGRDPEKDHKLRTLLPLLSVCTL